MTPTAYLLSYLEPVLTAVVGAMFTAMLILATIGLTALVVVALALGIRHRLAAPRRAQDGATRVRHAAARATQCDVPSRSIVTHGEDGHPDPSTMRLAGSQS